MKNRIKYLFLLFIYILCAETSAQNNRLYTIQNGLRSCDINTLLVDSRGLLWMGGNSPLCYFVGNRFHYLDNQDPQNHKKLYNSVNQIVEDKDDCYWIVSDGGLYYFDSRTLQHKLVPLSPDENEENIHPTRHMINLDASGNQKLVMTEGYGVYVLDNDQQKVNIQQTSTIQKLIEESFVAEALVDSKGDLWIGRISRSLGRIDLKHHKTKEVKMTPEAEIIVRRHLIKAMLEIPEKQALYIGTDGGILKYDYQKQLLTLITGNLSYPFTSLLYNKDHVLMAGSDSHGLWTIDDSDHVQPYQLTEPFFDLTMAKVTDIVMDKQGNILISLMQKGLYIISQHSKDFLYYPISLNGDGRNTSCISAIKQDSDGNYWIATDGAGVFKAEGNNLNNARPVNQGLNTLQVQDIDIDKRGTVWVGSYGGGIQCLTPGSNEFVSPEWGLLAPNAPVMSICYDPVNDYLYVATNGMGIHRLDLQKKQSEMLRYDDHQNVWTVDVHIDEDGTLWIIEVDNIHYINNKNGQKGILSKSILPGKPVCMNTVGKGDQKKVLIGTHNGLIIYDVIKGEAQHLHEGEKVQSINISDDDYWISTSTSLYAINRKTLNETPLNNMGGMFLGEFHQRSILHNSQDELLWGCDNGILCFNPKTLRKTTIAHNKILFTSLIAEGRIITHLSDPEMIDANILSAKKVKLKPDDSSFSMTFGIPNFDVTNDILYEYKLEGYDKKWIQAENGRLRYSTLPYGKYKLRVRACLNNQPDESTEQSIYIIVTPPWYATWWARLIYIIIGVSIVFYLWKVQRTRRMRKKELQRARHNEEIKEAKLRLFTSITHELRSPLTMIVTPVQHLLETTKDEQLRKNLEIMLQNCNQLLSTVRQITDIRKIDAGQFKLHFEETNINQYTQNIAHSFMAAAMVKKMQISVENPEQDIYAWIDPIHFEKVLMNILSNAFKFTPEGGRIRIHSEQQSDLMEITIYNEGKHIPEEDLQRLFVRFFQSKNGKEHMGTGIGLNLCYELVQLHHGNIEVRNVEPTGVEFVIHLPLGCSHLSADELSPRTQDSKPQQSTFIPAITTTITPAEETSQPVIEPVEEKVEEQILPPKEKTKGKRVLVVDDDPNICNYICEQLKADYSNIMVAHGGHAAWDLVLQNRPDIVITDVMMPDGNGIELAKKIKSNPELDNIPIIMVTGEDDDSLQLESLQLNVDHYLQKPFNMAILKGTIIQALRVRENTRKHSKRTDFGSEYGKMEMESSEENLYNRINKTLQAHLDDSEYGVQELSLEVGISRVHLNRKMKERYGLSPNAFIKSFRLKQAAHLLIRHNVNVSEVAYKVGFNTHSHFSSSFRDFFGMSPKDFVVFYKKEENEDALNKLLD